MSVLPHAAERMSGQRQPRVFKKKSQPHTHPERILTATPGFVIKASGVFPSSSGATPYRVTSQAMAAAALTGSAALALSSKAFAPNLQPSQATPAEWGASTVWGMSRLSGSAALGSKSTSVGLLTSTVSPALSRNPLPRECAMKPSQTSFP